MPDDTSLTDTTPAVAAPAPEWTPLTREAQEALEGKYAQSQKDREKFRTRADAVETAQKALDAEALKNKPLEDQLRALQAERDTMLTERDQLETKQAQTEIRTHLLESGVPKEVLSDASAAFRAWLEGLDETDIPDDDISNVITGWLESRPHFKSTGSPALRAATATGAPGIGARPVKPPDFTRASPGEINAWFDAQPKKR